MDTSASGVREEGNLGLSLKDLGRDPHFLGVTLTRDAGEGPGTGSAYCARYGLSEEHQLHWHDSGYRLYSLSAVSMAVFRTVRSVRSL